MTTAIGSTGTFVRVRIVVSGRSDATTIATATATPVPTSDQNAAVSRSLPGSRSSRDWNARKRQMTRTRPTPTLIARAAVRRVRVNWGMTAGHACEPGLTDSTPTRAHSGRWKIQSRAGAMIATAAATRASVHAWRDAPCHSSAAK